MRVPVTPPPVSSKEPTVNRDALAPVREYRTKPERLVAGLMTGTSADAVDAVLVRLKGEGLSATHEVLAERELPLDDELRNEVLAVAQAKTVEPERLMRLDVQLAEVYAEAVRAIADEAGVKLAAISAI